MGKLLWEPSKERILNANISKFIDYVNNKHGIEISSYSQLYDWSVEKIPDFWAAVWDFGGIKASQNYKEVIDDLNKFPGAKWFLPPSLLDCTHESSIQLYF